MLPFAPDLNVLLRHLITIGQTGSGKTGFVMGLIERAALARKPVLIIDPKGDLTNLYLRFAGYPAVDLAPYFGGDLARAEAEGARCRAALQADGLDPEADVQALIDAVDVRILTPGSDVAPVDVVGSLLRRPDTDDLEVQRGLATGSVSALLSLIGDRSDPVLSPEATLLARILGAAWAEGESLDFGTLLSRVVRPPFGGHGQFALDTALPPKDREAFALRLNQIVAAPAFDAWRRGAPLDVDAWLTPSPGRTPVTVLTLAHLSDEERSFFLTLLLHAVVGWSRGQSGTDELRALLVVDELFGLMPPHPRDPPTKAPLLTLLKQVRAVGLGVVLATQNPVDADHKALSNCGTWVVGRLITANDRERVIEVLGDAVPDVADTLRDLAPRTFIVRDPHGRCGVFRSLQTRSWLRGPLTRVELQALVPRAVVPDAPVHAAPVAPLGLEVVWLADPAALTGPVEVFARYHPALYARVAVSWATPEGRAGRTLHRLWWPLADRAAPQERALADEELRTSAPVAAAYAPLPAWLDAADEVQAARKAVLARAREAAAIVRWRHDVLGAWSRPDEPKEAFAQRIGAAPGDLEAEVVARAGVETTLERWTLVWVPGGDT